MINKKVCAYCGGKAETLDHIPSRNLYKEVGDLVPIKVPSCKDCNTGFSRDEEYFRSVVVAITYKESLTATTLFNGPIKRSIRYRPYLAMKMFRQMIPVELYSKNGIFLDKKAAVITTKEDRKRIFNVCDKYIKGLFLNEFKQLLPSEWVIKHAWLTAKLEGTLQKQLRTLRWEVINEHIFVYGYNSIPTTHQSVWCLAFFGRPLFFSFVLDKETANSFKSSNKS